MLKNFCRSIIYSGTSAIERILKTIKDLRKLILHDVIQNIHECLQSVKANAIQGTCRFAKKNF